MSYTIYDVAMKPNTIYNQRCGHKG